MELGGGNYRLYFFVVEVLLGDCDEIFECVESV